MHEEPHLLVEAADGDQRAYKKLYDRNVTSLFRFLSQFSNSRDEVEDWTQRAFIKAFGNLRGFDGQARFSTWLFRIAINEMKIDRRRSGIVQFQTFGEEEAASQADEEKDFIWNQTMKTWLNELDASKRAVFLLYEVEGYSHAEIASMLQIGESTSRTILTRTKEQLRERWNNEERGK
jgi:RNA polymerase sigma-70 factor (ECF subfamily)